MPTLRNKISEINFRKVSKVFIQIIIIPVTIGATILVQEWYSGKKEARINKAPKPYVAVLVSNEAIDFDISKDFLDGFKNARSNYKAGVLKSKYGKDIEISYEEDFLSEKETTVIANRLADDINCILVVGNANSTLTNSNMDAFINSKTYIPFLIPIATDNNILKKASTANYDTILQMLPNNNRQAITIERLVKTLTNSRIVAIYGDEENQSYSINLSRDIAEKIRKKGGTIVIEELIGPSNSFYNSISGWNVQKGKPEIIIYVGVSHHGLLLFDQISTFGITVPIIFTDGCLVTSLLSNSAKYSGRSFILSPADLKEEELFLPSYKSIGKDAFTLVSKLLIATDGSRKSIKEYIRKERKELGFVGDAGRYGFNPNGENEERDYFIYEMRGGRLYKFSNF